MSKIIDLTKVVDQSWALESGIQFKESGIPLTIRIQNPSSIEKKNRNQYVLDYLVSDALYRTTSIKLFMVEITLKGFENTLNTLSLGS